MAMVRLAKNLMLSISRMIMYATSIIYTYTIFIRSELSHIIAGDAWSCIINSGRASSVRAATSPLEGVTFHCMTTPCGLPDVSPLTPMRHWVGHCLVFSYCSQKFYSSSCGYLHSLKSCLHDVSFLFTCV